MQNIRCHMSSLLVETASRSRNGKYQKFTFPSFPNSWCMYKHGTQSGSMGPEQKSVGELLRTGSMRSKSYPCASAQDGASVRMGCMEQPSLAAILRPWSSEAEEEGLYAEDSPTEKWKHPDPWWDHRAPELIDPGNIISVTWAHNNVLNGSTFII